MAFGTAVVVLGLCACNPSHLPLEPESTTAQPTYLIGPGDTLNVFVYRAPELSAPDITVRPDGGMALPLVAEIEAAGKTPAQLAKEIEERLRPYVLEPNVTVMVRSFRGPPNQQIRVIGEVTQPIALPFRAGITVLDVMIEAKGLTRYAAGNRAEIIRRLANKDVPQAIRVRLSDLLQGGDVSQDLELRPGDTLLVPGSWF